MELKIIATLNINAGENAEAIVKALHKVVDATRQESGCISYDLHQDISQPRTYIFIEVWKSAEAIDAHNHSAHFQEFLQAVDGKVSLAVNVVEKIY